MCFDCYEGGFNLLSIEDMRKDVPNLLSDEELSTFHKVVTLRSLHQISHKITFVRGIMHNIYKEVRSFLASLIRTRLLKLFYRSKSIQALVLNRPNELFICIFENFQHRLNFSKSALFLMVICSNELSLRQISPKV